MLTEEAHHMFIGHTGMARVTRRTLEVMARTAAPRTPTSVRRAGAIDLPTIQKYINFWFSSALDLFGSESSSNAALYFASGIKGRPNEAGFEDHLALAQTYALDEPDGKGGVSRRDIPLRNAMNDATRNAYVQECEIFIDRWNDLIAKAGYRLPLHPAQPDDSGASIGVWAGVSHRPPRPPDPAGGLRGEAWRMAADRGRPGFRPQPDAAGVRARQDGGMDCAARTRDQQPPRVLRVRQAGVVSAAISSSALRTTSGASMGRKCVDPGTVTTTA